RWLFTVARHLHAHMSEPEIEVLLAERAANCGRAVPRSEIAQAVRNSKAVAWQPASPRPLAPGGKRWPAVNPEARRRVISFHRISVADLWEKSPARPDGDGAEGVIDALFPSNPLLCCGLSGRQFDVRPREVWRGKLAGLGLIVPNPMSAVFGTTQDGR